MLYQIGFLPLGFKSQFTYYPPMHGKCAVTMIKNLKPNLNLPTLQRFSLFMQHSSLIHYYKG